MLDTGVWYFGEDALFLSRLSRCRRSAWLHCAKFMLDIGVCVVCWQDALSIELSSIEMPERRMAALSGGTEHRCVVCQRCLSGQSFLSCLSSPIHRFVRVAPPRRCSSSPQVSAEEYVGAQCALSQTLAETMTKLASSSSSPGLCFSCFVLTDSIVCPSGT